MALRLDQSLPALEDRALVRVRRRAPGLTFDATLAPWWVVGEAAAMERAITNLLDNAAKWSPPEGRVTVRVSAGVLTVDDQGPGIDAEDLPHPLHRRAAGLLLPRTARAPSAAVRAAADRGPRGLPPGPSEP